MELLNLEKFKSEVHKTLISKLDLEKLSRVNSSQARSAVAGMVNEIIKEQKVPLSLVEQEKIQAELLDEVFGLGPLEPLLRIQRSRTSWSMTRTTCLSSVVEFWRGWKRRSATTAISCRSSTALFRASDAGWTNPLPWWMPACRTVPA